MKHLKYFYESQKNSDLLQEVYEYCEDISLDFKDLGLECKIEKKSLPGSVSSDLNLRSKAVLPVKIQIEVQDTSYGFGIDTSEFNSIVERLKNYSESQGLNFYVSRFDEHDNYYYDDIGYTSFEDYMKNPGNFFGFEIGIF
jgi:hypothetical protein